MMQLQHEAPSSFEVLCRDTPKDIPLPPDFVPGNNTVLCGRSKKNHAHPGNQRFCALMNQYRDSYVNATSRSQKSGIVANLVHMLRSKYQDEDNHQTTNGAFVRKDRKKGCFYEVGDVAAREKVGHALRDANRTKGRRESKSSVAKKRQRATSSTSPTSENETLAVPSPTTSASLGDIMQWQQNSTTEQSRCRQPRRLSTRHADALMRLECTQQQDSESDILNETMLPEWDDDELILVGDLSLGTEEDLENLFSS